MLTWGLTDTFRHPLLPRPASSGGGEDWEGSAIAASPGSEGPQRPPHFRGHPRSQPRLPEQVPQREAAGAPWWLARLGLRKRLAAFPAQPLPLLSLPPKLFRAHASAPVWSGPGAAELWGRAGWRRAGWGCRKCGWCRPRAVPQWEESGGTKADENTNATCRREQLPGRRLPSITLTK